MNMSIAQIGLADTDVHRLKTTMAMLITGGSLRCDWRMSPPENADFVVVSADAVVSHAQEIAGLKKAQAIAVLAGESEKIPANCLKLPWPIRLETLKSVLSIVEEKAQRGKGEPAEDQTQTSSATLSSNDLLKLAAIIRSGADSTLEAGKFWRIDGLSRSPLYVAPVEGSFYFTESLNGLRNLEPSVELKFTQVPAAEAQAAEGKPSTAKKPLVMLQWLIGLQTGPIGLLPWIKAPCSFRMRRFPAFQILHHTTAHRRIATALVRNVGSVGELGQLTGVDPVTISGFINASSLCGYLLTGSSPTKLAARARPNASKQGLFSIFRKALGIEAANA